MSGRSTRKEIDFRRIEPEELEFELDPARKGGLSRLLTIQSNIGAGGFGFVRKAIWKTPGKKLYVAVKCFYEDRADAKGGFVEELKGLTQLQGHKHIVQMFGANKGPESPYIVMEYAPLSLEKVLHNRVKDQREYMYDYKSDNVISWSQQLASGLEYVHSKKMLHRDIKPSNLLLFDEGRLLKLCDFGTSRKLDLSIRALTGGGQQPQALTNAVGTARYMAPEVITDNTYNESCDVFSFGIAVWEMLARRRPVLTKSNIELVIMYAVAKGARPQKLVGLPMAISDMIELCWEEPSKRPHMSEISRKLNYLCRYVDLTLPIKDMTRASYNRSVSVMYSQGDQLEPPSGDAQYDSLQDNS